MYAVGGTTSPRPPYGVHLLACGSDAGDAADSRVGELKRRHPSNIPPASSPLLSTFSLFFPLLTGFGQEPSERKEEEE